MYHQREWLTHFPSVGMSNHRKTVKKSSVTLAISLKYGAIMAALSFNAFLNLSAEVGVGSKIFFPAFNNCPLQFHKRLNIGFYSDMAVIYLFERCAICTCNVFIFTLNFSFLDFGHFWCMLAFNIQMKVIVLDESCAFTTISPSMAS